ncbi:type II toxin-antitoxin system RelE/ParE family toxin [Deinococcus aquatilis]|uniref:type II toxin-antitoxin system RelE/ParE family toxin n=1 Tax=Deinococcus aquatilis TaxID=519440 RepID=UPI0009FC29FA|nr:type II toxin-antitoxin system RelE/ParE family toxin [Deinococcus aquatilis]
MARHKKPTEPATAPTFEFLVKFDAHAAADLERIDDHATITAILQQAMGLRTEPLKQGKPLKKALKGYRCVQVTRHHYQIVYRVIKQAENLVIAVMSVHVNRDRDAHVNRVSPHE